MCPKHSLTLEFTIQFDADDGRWDQKVQLKTADDEESDSEDEYLDP